MVVCAMIILHQASALIWERELKMSGLLCQGSLVRREGHGMIPHAVPFFFYTLFACLNCTKTVKKSRFYAICDDAARISRYSDLQTVKKVGFLRRPPLTRGLSAKLTGGETQRKVS